MSENIQCFNCGKAHSALMPLSVRESCSHCSSDLHCCRMCNNYAEYAHNDCKEPLAEKVSDKEKANYCDYFSLNRNPDVSPGDQKKTTLDALDDLFKK